MKNLKMFYALVFSIIGGSLSWSAEETVIENKENFFSNCISFKETDTLKKNIESIGKKIEKAHQDGNVKIIFQAYEHFQKLSYQSKEWEMLGQSLNIVKWPSQPTWKEAVGGELFFPQKIMDWETSYVETYLLDRIDIIWAVAMGAKFNHPFSTYYLAKILDNIHSNTTDAEKPDLFLKLYSKAFENLENYQEMVNVCYILGRSYQERGILIERLDYKKSMKYHMENTNLKNQYHVLKLKGKYRKIYSPPSSKEYLDLARAGYHLAYLEAANLLKETHEQIEVLSEAVKNKYFPALMRIGEIYEYLYKKNISIGKKDADTQAFLNEARDYYEKAGQHGVIESYIILGKTYVGDIILNNGYEDKKKFRSLPSETVEKAASFFKLAGEGHHPEGWDYLVQLYLNLYMQLGNEIETNRDLKEEYGQKVYESLEKGIALGSGRAYLQAYNLYSAEIFKELCAQYGISPQEKAFRKIIEKFLQ